MERDAHRLRNGLIWTTVLAALLLGIGLAVPALRGVLNRATGASWGWVVGGVGLELLSCLGYVAVVRMVLPRGPKRDLQRLAWAEEAFGAVVPVGGAGGLAVGAWAMRAWGVSWARIANRSAVIFLLTSAINGVVLAVAGLGIMFGIGRGHLGIVYGLVPAAAAILAIAGFALLPMFRRGREPRGKVGKALAATSDWVHDTESTALRPNWRMLGALAYLLCDIAVLWACLRAVGVSAPILPLIVGYQVGYLSNLIPIPGGVGVLEGGLLGALLLYGLPAAPTAAAVILYHAIALWVPTLGGTYGFLRLRKSIGLNVAGRPRLVELEQPAGELAQRAVEPEQPAVEPEQPAVEPEQPAVEHPPVTPVPAPPPRERDRQRPLAA
jgi:uncharacterized membrane protein YbhN (UPF0104 family)